ncbi:hypothetical protein L6452_01362 [Arctium lappa]|uniref:Uncharacterized protein n=1 Tax=Arctium lappa TaxID=4217 RepID=A0ACB9FHC3_ARCLA|nr:hypothetical protein L6452_01362 [Arctium lappa]
MLFVSSLAGFGEPKPAGEDDEAVMSGPMEAYSNCTHDTHKLLIHKGKGSRSLLDFGIGCSIWWRNNPKLCCQTGSCAPILID